MDEMLRQLKTAFNVAQMLASGIQTLVNETRG